MLSPDIWKGKSLIPALHITDNSFRLFFHTHLRIMLLNAMKIPVEIFIGISKAGDEIRENWYIFNILFLFMNMVYLYIY